MISHYLIYLDFDVLHFQFVGCVSSLHGQHMIGFHSLHREAMNTDIRHHTTINADHRSQIIVSSFPNHNPKSVVGHGSQ